MGTIFNVIASRGSLEHTVMFCLSNVCQQQKQRLGAVNLTKLCDIPYLEFLSSLTNQILRIKE